MTNSSGAPQTARAASAAGVAERSEQSRAEQDERGNSVIRRRINLLLLAIPLVWLIQGRVTLFAVPLPFISFEWSKAFFEQLFATVSAPVGLDAEPVSQGVVFALAALSLIPLAGFVESAVEELAELLGFFIGGLLHTTFGNVAEMTIALFVLLNVQGPAGKEIVLGAIAGVIVRNTMLGLGLATLFGCLRYGSMKFDPENATEYSTVLALAVVGLSLPTLTSRLPIKGPDGRPVGLDFPLAPALAVVLLILYVGYIAFAVFQFRHGAHLRTQELRKRITRRRTRERERQLRAQGLTGDGELLVAAPDTQALFPQERAKARARAYPKGHRVEQRRQRREQKGEKSFWDRTPLARGLVALVVLAFATALVASMSEAFAGSIDYLKERNPALQPYDFFLGLVIIPVLGGIVELYGTVGAAREKRMELTMALTAGACIQMILLVTPILVLVGYFTGNPLDLIFQPLVITIFGAATALYLLLSRDGESTWLEGVQLITLWLLVAVVAIFLPPSAPKHEGAAMLHVVSALLGGR